MPLTGDGVDKVVHTEETWNEETEDMEESVSPDDPPPPPGSFTFGAVGRRGPIQGEQENQQAQRAVGRHSYNTIAEE